MSPRCLPPGDFLLSMVCKRFSSPFTSTLLRPTKKALDIAAIDVTTAVDPIRHSNGGRVELGGCDICVLLLNYGPRCDR